MRFVAWARRIFSAEYSGQFPIRAEGYVNLPATLKADVLVIGTALRSPMQIGGCARTAHESNVFVALGLAVSEKQIPKLLKTLETKIVDGANREDSGSLQAGGHRFDPGHVHQCFQSLQALKRDHVSR